MIPEYDCTISTKWQELNAEERKTNNIHVSANITRLFDNNLLYIVHFTHETRSPN